MTTTSDEEEEQDLAERIALLVPRLTQQYVGREAAGQEART